MKGLNLNDDAFIFKNVVLDGTGNDTPFLSVGALTLNRSIRIKNSTSDGWGYALERSFQQCC